MQYDANLTKGSYSCGGIICLSFLGNSHQKPFLFIFKGPLCTLEP
jgi:hypothetical protein